MEDEIKCYKCKQVWLVKTHKKGFVAALSKLTGYLCSQCAGWEPETWNDPKATMFPARLKEDWMIPEGDESDVDVEEDESVD